MVRTYAIRSTLHIIPSKDYYTYVLGGASDRLLNWIDTIAKKRNYLPREERRRLLYEPILEEIKERAVTEEELRTLVDERARPFGLREGVWTGVGEMAFLGLLVHAGKQGSHNLWIRSDCWIPGLGTRPDRQTCRAELLRKYKERQKPQGRVCFSQSPVNLQGSLGSLPGPGEKHPSGGQVREEPLPHKRRPVPCRPASTSGLFEEPVRNTRWLFSRPPRF